MSESASKSPRTRPRFPARIVLVILAIAVVVVLVFAVQTPLIQKWLFYESNPGPLDGEWGLRCDHLVKHYEILPGPGHIVRLHDANDSLVLEQNRPSISWIRMSDALIVMKTDSTAAELIIDEAELAHLVTAPSEGAEELYLGSLRLPDMRKLERPVEEMPKTAFRLVVNELRNRGMKLAPVPPDIADEEVHVEAGILGESLRKCLAELGYTWAIGGATVRIIPLSEAGDSVKSYVPIAIPRTARTLATQPANFSFEGQRLIEVMNFMGQITGIEIVVADESLHGVGITCEAHNIVIRSFFEEVPKRLGISALLLPDGKIALVRSASGNDAK